MVGYTPQKPSQPREQAPAPHRRFRKTQEVSPVATESAPKERKELVAGDPAPMERGFGQVTKRVRFLEEPEVREVVTDDAQDQDVSEGLAGLVARRRQRLMHQDEHQLAEQFTEILRHRNQTSTMLL